MVDDKTSLDLTHALPIISFTPTRPSGQSIHCSGTAVWTKQIGWGTTGDLNREHGERWGTRKGD